MQASLDGRDLESQLTTADNHSSNKTIHEPPKTVRASTSQSGLADSIRALREASQQSSKLNTAVPKAEAGLRRKTKPSPLQQFSTPAPKLYGRDPLSPISTASRSSEDHVRSPKERLGAFLASEGNIPTPNSAPARSVSSTTPTHGQLRNVSAPNNPPGFSPPASPKSMLPNNALPRPVMARNPSIESTASQASSSVAQSSRSNSVNAGKTSLDGNADVAGLIAAAGSAEAALLSLLKERQSTQSHNSQLWRLVEKQRAMILGLNKDLERALKDKERYRKKMKELTAQDPKKTNAVNRTDSALDREDSESPAPQHEERQPTVDEFPQVPSSTAPPVKTPIPPPLEEIRSIQRSDTGSTLATQSPQDSHSMVESFGEHTPIEASPVATSPQQVVQPKERSHSPALDLPLQGPKSPVEEQRSSPAVASPPAVVTPPSPPRQHVTPHLNTEVPAPTLSLIEATPLADSGNFPSPPTRTFKKPVPAPLNLSQSNHSQPAVHVPNANIEEAIVSPLTPEDKSEIERPELVNRGRRRTRADDDKAREEFAIKEEEARSLSKKSIKSKSKSKTPAPIEPPSVAQTGYYPTNVDPGNSPTLPTSPRQPQNLNAKLLSPASSEASSSGSHGRSSGTAPLLSPGLPVSPRPVDRPMNQPSPRMPKANISSPPMSPRLAPTQSSLAPHPVNQHASYLLSSPSAYPAPLFSKPPSQPPPAVPVPPAPQTQQSPTKLQPPQQPRDTGRSTPTLLVPAESPSSETIFRGFVSDQYPNLLLPPNVLPLIDVRVFSSRMRPSRHSILIARPNEEDPVFLLGIYSRADGKQLWRVEKTIMSLNALHQEVRSLCPFDGKVPDRRLFSGHAPAQIDARRAALNAYFDLLLDTPLPEKAALVVCEFFSRDVIGAEADDSPVIRQTSPKDASSPKDGPKSKAKREGYLTKRGKNFGGWKARYFVLESTELRYYDSPGGPQIGVIKLLNAQIGKQSQQQMSNQSPSRKEDDADNQYRHAFLILEPKKKDSSSLVRHVLCAESDNERDAWVEALLQYVDAEEKAQGGNVETAKRPATAQSNAPSLRGEPAQAGLNLIPPSQSQGQPQRSPAPLIQEPMDPNALQAFSYDNTIPAEAPIVGPSYKEYTKQQGLPSPTMNSNGFGYMPQKTSADKVNISGPTNGVVIQDAGMWGNKTPSKEKKRSIFAGFRGRSSSDLNAEQKMIPPAMPEVKSRPPLNRPVFGVPLGEAVDVSQPMGVDIPLPAVVYRCIEYLQVRGAVQEEGIFRLSGSNIVIKALRDRFNTEGDVRLLDGDYYDVHAVASLLKLYLRELPVSILTREHHLDFLKVLDFDSKPQKIAAFNTLVHRLPAANRALLQALCSFLIDIVENADRNKMNVRNVGIVFAPTLNIPAPLISMFLTDYATIFGRPMDEPTAPLINEPQQQDIEQVRSPRPQMIQDLPAPIHNPQSHQAPMPGFKPLSQSGVPSSQQAHLIQQQHQQARNTPTPGSNYEPTYRSATPPSAIFAQPQANGSTTSIGTTMSHNNAAYNSINGALSTLPSQQQPVQGGVSPALGTGSNPNAKKNRRESSMLGANLMQARKPSRQTLANTNSSHIPDNAWMGYQREQERRAKEAERVAEMMNGGILAGGYDGRGLGGSAGDSGVGSSRDGSEERGLW